MLTNPFTEDELSDIATWWSGLDNKAQIALAADITSVLAEDVPIFGPISQRLSALDDANGF